MSEVISVSSRRWIQIAWCLLAFMACLYSGISIRSDCYLSCNDTFYYLSVADNMIENHVMLDGTTIPPGPIVTPQNGITIVFYFLRSCGLSHEDCIYTVLAINAVCLLASVFWLRILCSYAGLNRPILQLAVIAAYLGGVRVYLWMFMSPINDMIFLSLSLLLMVLLLRLDADWCASHPTPHMVVRIGLAIFIAILLPHFRINAVFVPLALGLGAVLLKHWRTLLLAVGLTIVMTSSLYGVYPLLKILGYSYEFTDMQRLLAFNLYSLFFSLLPESLFRNLIQAGNLLYLPFYAAIIMAVVEGVRKRNLTLLVIVFVCGMTIGLTLIYAVPLVRYLWPITALMYLVLLRYERLRPIGLLFIVALMVNSYWIVYDGIQVPDRTAFWQYAARNSPINVEKDILLLSQNHRTSWYFMKLPAAANAEAAEDMDALPAVQAVYLGGDRDYRQQEMDWLANWARAHGYRMEFENLTPDYQDKAGRAFYRLSFTDLRD